MADVTVDFSGFAELQKRIEELNGRKRQNSRA